MVGSPSVKQSTSSTIRRAIGSIIGTILIVMAIRFWVPFIYYTASGHDSRGEEAGLVAFGFILWGFFGALSVLSFLAGWGPRSWIFRISLIVFLVLLTVATTVTITGAH